MSITLVVPPRYVSYEAAGGDPFLIYFLSIYKDLERWMNFNGIAYELGEQDSQTDPDNFGPLEILFEEAEEAHAFLCFWYTADDLGELTISEEELGKLAGPLERSWGCHCDDQVVLLWGMTEILRSLL